MSARAEWEPLSWDEAEQNRLKAAGGRRRKLNIRKRSSAVSAAGRNLIEYELECSHRCMEEVQTELAECKACVQTWSPGEPLAARVNLLGGSESAAANGGVEHFLVGWLEQLEEELALISVRVERLVEQASAAAVHSSHQQGSRHVKTIAHASKPAVLL